MSALNKTKSNNSCLYNIFVRYLFNSSNMFYVNIIQKKNKRSTGVF